MIKAVTVMTWRLYNGEARHTHNPTNRTYDEVGPPRPCPPCSKLQLAQGTSLANPGAPELPAGKSDGDPGDLVRHADDVLQPAPELPAADEARAKADDTDTARSKEGEQGNAGSRRPRKDCRGLWRCGRSKAVEYTRSSKERVIAGGENGSEDDGVHE